MSPGAEGKRNKKLKISFFARFYAKTSKMKQK